MARFGFASGVMVVGLLWVPSGVRGEAPGGPGGGDCGGLLRSATRALAEEQYERMRAVAQDRLERCPGPESTFLLGLAQANLFDAGLIADPPEREWVRQEALRQLRVAVAGEGGLSSDWLLVAGEWIVYLQGRGPAAAGAVRGPDGGRRNAVSVAAEGPAWDVPAVPPPRPSGVFPWGPLVTGTAGVISLGVGMGLAWVGSARHQAADEGLHGLRLRAETLTLEQRQAYLDRVEVLRAAGDRYERWSRPLLLAGGAAALVAVGWYLLGEPEGEWQWALLPGGLQARVRF